MGILDFLRRPSAHRDIDAIVEERVAKSLAELEAKGHPVLPSVLAHSTMSGDGIVQSQDQNFEKYLDTVRCFPWLSAGIDAIGDMAASVPWRVYVNDELVENHPLQKILDRPNPEGNQSFRKQITDQLYYTGNCTISGQGKKEEMPWADLEELWVIPFDRMAPKYSGRARKGSGKPEIVSWKYGLANAEQTFPATSIIHIRIPHPVDIVFGISAVRKLEPTLRLMWSAMKYSEAFFDNGGSLGPIITSDTGPTDAEKTAAKLAFEQRHSSVSKAFRAVWLWASGMKVTSSVSSLKDAYAHEIMEHCRKTILASLRVKPFAVSDIENANYSNALEQERSLYNGTIIPIHDIILDALNNSPLVRAYGEGTEIRADYSGIEALQPNRGEQMTANVAGVRARIITRNEARENLGYDPTDGGDEFEAPAPAFPGPGVGGPGDPGDEDDEERGKDSEAKSIRKLIEETTGERASRDQLWTLVKASRAPGETKLRDAADGIIAGMRRRVLAKARAIGEPDSKMPSVGVNIFDMDEEARAWVDGMTPAMVSAARDGKRRFVARKKSTGAVVAIVRKAEDVQEPSAALLEYVRKRAATKISTVAESRRDEIAAIAERAAKEEKTVREFVNDLLDAFDDGAPHWAERIARTEGAAMSNAGAVEGIREAGFKTKEWLASRDADVRESHEEIDGTSVPVEADFVLKGGRGPWPGEIDSPEESANCRCGVVVGEE